MLAIRNNLAQLHAVVLWTDRNRQKIYTVATNFFLVFEKSKFNRFTGQVYKICFNIFKGRFRNLHNIFWSINIFLNQAFVHKTDLNSQWFLR